MLENFIFGLMVIIAVGAGIWVWWLETHGTEPEQTNTDQEG